MARTRRPSPQTIAVLLDLAERGDEWSHGYDLCGRLDIAAGTLYPILMRLHERGLLEARWENDPPRGRPARHLYRLSPEGAVIARETEASGAPQTAREVTPSSRVGAAGWAIA